MIVQYTLFCFIPTNWVIMIEMYSCSYIAMWHDKTFDTYVLTSVQIATFHNVYFKFYVTG